MTDTGKGDGPESSSCLFESHAIEKGWLQGMANIFFRPGTVRFSSQGKGFRELSQMSRSFSVILFFLWSFASRLFADETPVPQVALRETVTVHLAQVEVTAYPDEGDLSRCVGLGSSDISLEINGLPRPIVAIDPIGPLENQTSLIPPGKTKEVAPANVQPKTQTERTPLQLVLFLDLDHFFDPRRTNTDRLWPELRSRRSEVSERLYGTNLAFDWIEGFVHEGFHDGDRIMLVHFSNWVVIDTPWMTSREEVVRSIRSFRENLDEIVMKTRTKPLTTFFQAWGNFLDALGRTPGHKDVLYFAADLGAGVDQAENLYAAAQHAQANRVTVHSFDVRWEDHNTPYGLGPMAWHQGGQVFSAQSVSDVVNKVRTLVGCKFLVSFKPDPKDWEHGFPLISVKSRKPGLSLRAPASFSDPARVVPEREKKDALFLLPAWSEGLVAQGTLVAVRPSSHAGKWEVLLKVKIALGQGVKIPEEAREVSIEYVIWQGGIPIAESKKTISGEDLRAFGEARESNWFTFPVEVPRGEVQFAVVADVPGTSLAATVRQTVEIGKTSKSRGLAPNKK